jgi:hypothetical protein
LKNIFLSATKTLYLWLLPLKIALLAKLIYKFIHKTLSGISLHCEFLQFPSLSFSKLCQCIIVTMPVTKTNNFEKNDKKGTKPLQL